jgi:hypothetical protein
VLDVDRERRAEVVAPVRSDAREGSGDCDGGEHRREPRLAETPESSPKVET